MSKMDVLDFLRKKHPEWFTIRELSREVGISVRNIRRSVLSLEAGGWILGRCRGDYEHWNREFKFNDKLE